MRSPPDIATFGAAEFQSSAATTTSGVDRALVSTKSDHDQADAIALDGVVAVAKQVLCDAIDSLGAPTVD